MTSDDRRSVEAQYTSPSGAHTFHLPVKAPCTANPTTSERTAYLSALRANTKQLQADVNKFLTEKMEEDKARSAADDKRAKKEEELDEQNYGEEQAEDAD